MLHSLQRSLCRPLLKRLHRKKVRLVRKMESREMATLLLHHLLHLQKKRLLLHQHSLHNKHNLNKLKVLKLQRNMKTNLWSSDVLILRLGGQEEEKTQTVQKTMVMRRWMEGRGRGPLPWTTSVMG
jgi:hypothetical protein